MLEEEKNKKLEYFQREDVKTMQKDIAALQETVAKKERQKITQIKTEEELQKEKERVARAQREAEERTMAQVEVQKRQEELKTLRQERERKEQVLGEEEKEKAEIKAETFREKLGEVQIKEEEERKRFLERVARRLGEQTVIPTPAPASPLAPQPDLTTKEISQATFIRKPSLMEKLWIRVVLSCLALAILAGLATFWYWYLSVREETGAPLPPPAQIIEKELIIPPAFISIDKTLTLEISQSEELARLLSQALKEDLGEKQFTRILIKNTSQYKIVGLKEFFDVFQVKTPADFYNNLDNDFTLFIYSSQKTNRLGFITQAKPGLLSLTQSWEPTLETDSQNLFASLGKAGPSIVPYFRETVYKNRAFRYLSFPPENFGICWALVDNYFIFTSSGESMIKTIDKIK